MDRMCIVYRILTTCPKSWKAEYSGEDRPVPAERSLDPKLTILQVDWPTTSTVQTCLSSFSLKLRQPQLEAVGHVAGRRDR